MDVAKFKAETKPLAVSFRGEVINVIYRPNIYTIGLQRKLQREIDGNDLSAVTGLFLALIDSWDLSDESGDIPLTVAGIESVPMWILGAIQTAIQNETEMTEEEKRGSLEPSALPPQDSTPPSPSSQSTGPSSSNGLETSESQTVSAVGPSS